MHNLSYIERSRLIKGQEYRIRNAGSGVQDQDRNIGSG